MIAINFPAIFYKSLSKIKAWVSDYTRCFYGM